MTRRAAVEIFLERYGEPVSVSGAQVSAVIRPLQYKSGAKLNLPAEYYDDLHYLYTGPAARKLSAADTLTSANRSYKVKRADTVLMSGEELYVWAVIKALSPNADSEVYLEADGAKVAAADSYTVKNISGSGMVTSWGESQPTGISAGAVSYEITLKNVCPESGVDLCALQNFRVVIPHIKSKTVYSGCYSKNITDTGGCGNEIRRSMEILAVKRAVEKGDD